MALVQPKANYRASTMVNLIIMISMVILMYNTTYIFRNKRLPTSSERKLSSISQLKSQVLIVSIRINDSNKFAVDENCKTEDIAARYAILSNNKQSYADKWNATYLEFNHRFIDSIPDNRWQKPFILKSFLNDSKYDKFDYLFWMDADAAFINCNIDLLDIIKNEWINPDLKPLNNSASESKPDLIFSGDHNAVANNGIFAIRNSGNNEWINEFMHKWTYIQSKFPITLETLADNPPFIALIMGFDPFQHELSEYESYVQKSWKKGKVITKQNIIETMPKIPQHIRKHIGIIPQNKWNSYNYSSPNEFIIHCAGSSDCKENLDKLIQNNSNC